MIRRTLKRELRSETERTHAHPHTRGREGGREESYAVEGSQSEFVGDELLRV